MSVVTVSIIIKATGFSFWTKNKKTVCLHSTQCGRKVQNFGDFLIINNPLRHLYALAVLTSGPLRKSVEINFKTITSCCQKDPEAKFDCRNYYQGNRFFLFEKNAKTVYLHSTESGRKVQNFGNFLLIKSPLWYFLLFCSPLWSFAVFSQTRGHCDKKRYFLSILLLPN